MKSVPAAQGDEMSASAAEPPRISTGSEGLDNILGRRVRRNRLYLYEGRPGTGKTTIALQFLLEGARQGERVLYITLSETARTAPRGAAPWLVARRRRHLRAGAAGNDARSRARTDRVPPRRGGAERDDEADLRARRAVNPTRVVLDSLSELRLLAQSPLRYRRQVLALKHFFTTRQLHRHPARRSDLAAGRPSASLDLARRGVAGATRHGYGAERRACAWSRCAASSSAAATTISRSRRAAWTIYPQAGRRRTPQELHRRHHVERQRRARPVARGRT